MKPRITLVSGLAGYGKSKWWCTDGFTTGIGSTPGRAYESWQHMGWRMQNVPLNGIQQNQLPDPEPKIRWWEVLVGRC